MSIDIDELEQASKTEQFRGAHTVSWYTQAPPESVRVLLKVVRVALAWRDAKCSRLPGCDSFESVHDARCQWTLAERRLVNALTAIDGVPGYLDRARECGGGEAR